jgi:hypothetical protein
MNPIDHPHVVVKVTSGGRPSVSHGWLTKGFLPNVIFLMLRTRRKTKELKKLTHNLKKMRSP